MSSLHDFRITYQLKDETTGEWTKRETHVRGRTEVHAAAVFGAMMLHETDGALDALDMLHSVRRIGLEWMSPAKDMSDMVDEVFAEVASPL